MIMKTWTAIIAATALLFVAVSSPTGASAQSRGWQMKQGIYCIDGRRAMTAEICARRAARAAAVNKKK